MSELYFKMLQKNSLICSSKDEIMNQIKSFSEPEAEFKEFDPRLKFETRLKHGWFHLKLY